MALKFLNDGYFAGKVGIGTVSPTEKLQVYEGGLTAYKSYTTTNAGAILTAYQSTFSPFTKTTDLVAGSDGTVPSEIRFLTRTSGTSTIDERVRITSTGKVGIGTPSPSVQLDIEDSSNVIVDMNTTTANANTTIRLQESGTVKATIGYDGTNDGLILTTGGFTAGNGIFIDDSQNVGIGTNSPSQKLTIRDDSTTVYSTGDAGTNTGDLVLQNNNETDNNFNRISFQSNSDNNQTGDLLDAARITAIYPDHVGGNPSGELAFETKADAGSMAEAMRIDRDGNVGIGTTSPVEKLEVNGRIKVQTSSGSLTLKELGSSSATIAGSATVGIEAAGNFRVKTNVSNEAFTVLSTGNVGIGNTSPTAKLHVAGTGLFTGLVSGITPVNAANFVTKAYVDGSGGGTGPFLPLAGGTMTGTNGVLMPDNFRLKIGTSEDLLIFHDGTDSQIFNQAGDLKIRNDQDDGDIVFMSDNGSGGTTEYFTINGTVERNIFYKNTKHPDDVVAYFGNGDDLQIYHTGSHSFIQDVGTGMLAIDTNGTDVRITKTDSEFMAKFVTDAEVQLYYDGSKKFETTSTGVTVTGEIIANGNITSQTTGGAGLNLRRDDTSISGTNTLGSISFQGDDPVDGTFNTGAAIFGKADGSWSSGAYPSQLLLQTRNTSGSLVTALTLAKDQTAEFTSSVKATQLELESAVPSILFDETDVTANWRNRVQSGGYRIQYASDGTTFTDYISLGASAFTLAKDTTFTEQAFSAATSSGDASSTLTTKGYVDSLITGATIYRGTWDPDVSLNSGYGNPNLNTVTQTSGYYYICSADGTATPNGATTEPNSWNTGDWVIWNDDIGTSGEWQKIDNSSVLSGVGTGQTVALWEGAGSVTDSETLGNAPITVSGNNSTFAGNVIAEGSLITRSVNANVTISGDTSGNIYYNNASGEHRWRANGSSVNSMNLSSTLLTVNENATFAGDVTLTNGQLTVTHDTNNVAKIIQADTNLGNNSYTFEVDSSAQVSNMSAAGAMAVDVNSGRAFTITGAGNVGIGTATNISSPLTIQANGSGNALSIIGRANGTNDEAVIGFYEYDGTTRNAYIIKEAGDLAFATGTGGSASERMRISSNGSVGINSTSTSYKLFVGGTSRFANSVYVDTNTGADALWVTRLGGASEALKIYTTDSSSYLDVYQDENQSGYGNLAFRADDTGNNNGYLWFGHRSGGEAMRIIDNGNVGIGTTSPQSRLHVAGGIQMADDTATASAAKVGTMRYRTGTEYVDVTGAELVINGSFATDTSWNKNSNWTISGGTANADGTSNNDLNQADNLPTAGSVYRVIFEITAITQGQVRIEYGDAATDFLSAVGRHEYILTATSTDRVRVQCQNSFIGSIDNLSIVEVTAEDASYADMCMQTGASTYEWVNIVRNTY